MDRLKKHEDELDFFVYELKCRRVLRGHWKDLPISLYGAGSDYGRSWIAPLVVAFFVVAYGAVPLMLHFGRGKELQAIGLSLSNTFNLFGFRRDFFDQAVVGAIPGPLKLIAAIQTIIGSACLFLFGLGLRNRFRMR